MHSFSSTKLRLEEYFWQSPLKSPPLAFCNGGLKSYSKTKVSKIFIKINIISSLRNKNFVTTRYKECCVNKLSQYWPISAVVSSYFKSSLKQVLSMYTSKRLKVSLMSSFGPHSAEDVNSRNDFLRQLNAAAFS